MPARQYGVFLPVGNGGWMVSQTAPHPQATYAYNRKVAIDAETVGFDFIMSMAKWKGFGGSTDHWGQTLESMTLMAALAEATSKVHIWATLHANVHHPAIAAKMLTTLQDISGGRAGLNIVNGSYAAEFEQMGLWDPALSHAERYRMTEEWTQAVTRLWTEDTVSLTGDFFTLDECESRPHPAVRPAIISAGRSEQGRRFQARYADGAFLSADNLTQMRDYSRSVHEMAAGHGRAVRTYSMLTVVLDESDAAAAAKAARYSEGLDKQALTAMRTSWGIPAGTARAWAEGASGTEAFQTPYVTGGPDTVVAHIEQIVTEAELDGLMLIFPDYHADLLPFGEKVLPVLRASQSAVTTRKGCASRR